MWLRTRGHQFELPAVKCEFNKRNFTLFDRFLIIYDLCVFTCIIFIFVFHCTHVRMSYVLNSYLLTYLVQRVCQAYWRTRSSRIGLDVNRRMLFAVDQLSVTRRFVMWNRTRQTGRLSLLWWSSAAPYYVSTTSGQATGVRSLEASCNVRAVQIHRATFSRTLFEYVSIWALNSCLILLP